MTPVHLASQVSDERSQLVCGRCGKLSTVLVLDPGKPYVYPCASCETNDPAEDETTRTADIEAENPA